MLILLRPQLECSNGAIFCSDIGPECNEISSIPQSGFYRTSHWLVSKYLNNEVDSDQTVMKTFWDLKRPAQKKVLQTQYFKRMLHLLQFSQ
jgi:hypothetical protein